MMTLTYAISASAWAACDASYGCGTGVPGVSPCQCAFSKVVVPHEVVFPGGTTDMSIEITVVDSTPGFPCSYDVVSFLQMAGGPTSVLTVGVPTPDPILVYPNNFLTGTGTATVSVTTPSSVDATRNASRDSVYQFQATVFHTTPPASTNADSCIITWAGGNEPFAPNLSAYGKTVDSSLREVNGDLCVVPNNEAQRAQGFAPPLSEAYQGRYGGHFLDSGGALTTAPFEGRILKEALTAVGNDPCFEQAVNSDLPNVRDPLMDHGCIDLENFLPDEGSWQVGYLGKNSWASPVPAVTGAWGTRNVST